MRIWLWEKIMQKKALAAAAIVVLIGGSSRLQAADVMPLNDILKNAEQAEHLPNFGPPRGKLTPATPESLTRELPDDRFVADRFPPTRLIFPDGTQELYVTVRVLKVVPLTGGEALKAYAKDVPVDSDVAKSAPVVEHNELVYPQVLFDQRRVKEWPKVTRFWKEN